MKKISLTLIALVGALGLSACGPNTSTGAVAGGLIGAGAGAIIGNQSGRPLEGAAIGGAIGAGSGALLGNAKDKREEQQYYNQGGGYGHNHNQGGYNQGPPPQYPPPRY